LRGHHRVSATTAVNDRADRSNDRIEDPGLVVPRDIAMARYDNTYFASDPPVSLTLVDPDSHGIAAHAVRRFVDRIARSDRLPHVHQLPPKLVLRSSCDFRVGAGHIE
jgi:DNA-binding LacI/PurR family transcriptional regulator